MKIEEVPNPGDQVRWASYGHRESGTGTVMMANPYSCLIRSDKPVWFGDKHKRVFQIPPEHLIIVEETDLEPDEPETWSYEEDNDILSDAIEELDQLLSVLHKDKENGDSWTTPEIFRYLIAKTDRMLDQAEDVEDMARTMIDTVTMLAATAIQRLTIGTTK